MKISALIIDDEPLARKLISNLLLTVSEIEVIGHCKTGKEAITTIDTVRPDLLFLDIKFKDMTGFDILEKISVKTPIVIFVSAFDSYALKAFNFFAFDYLLKPFNEERFYTSVNKAIETFNKKDTSQLQKKVDDLLNYIQDSDKNSNINFIKRIPVPLKNKTIFINPDDIMYITASNYYAEIYTQSGKYLLRESMYNMLLQLNPDLFIRIHRSTIVNIEFAQELISSGYGAIDVKMKDHKLFRISKSYKKEFLIKMGLKNEKVH
ncbi:LytTR family DNA-binding domain-containing protein [Aquimarina sp. 2201CG5-10]|uniref:LytR/AlgR family response regulator transcription factor n=1 Tax=Aquimarina callyspongiae TaxID=3098150 RepID=UPI002AB3635D|nr:LytTR family DNA-binding domain-containing protein [Aquimarina sp. 2201CG5-10]MDY8136222.1 LytTR family DNA-binding domain-containing protein [Aquimarina sp. 2201CG5-10]